MYSVNDKVGTGMYKIINNQNTGKDSDSKLKNHGISDNNNSKGTLPDNNNGGDNRCAIGTETPSSKPKKPSYRILLSSIDAMGNANCVLHFGSILQKHGHDITFTNRQYYRPIIKQRGFKFIPFDDSLFRTCNEGKFHKWIEGNLNKFRCDATSRFHGWTVNDKDAFSSLVEVYQLTNQALRQVLEDHEDKFDVIIGDFVIRFPSLYKFRIPYIPLLSVNPLILYPEGPPLYSGLSLNADAILVKQFKVLFADATTGYRNGLREWWAYEQIPLPRVASWIVDEPTYFGLYFYPRQLDYDECGPRMDKWTRVDPIIFDPEPTRPYVIPDNLANSTGKLIYFTLGLAVMEDVHAVNYLLEILSRSKHRFIVCLGHRSSEINMYPNMCGDFYINQISAIQQSDLVISSGGTLTVVESLYYGKPLIVMPFFFDQFDNAQRIDEFKLGRRLDFWCISEHKLLTNLDEMLEDEQLYQRVSDFAESMKHSADSHQMAVEMFENFMDNIK